MYCIRTEDVTSGVTYPHEQSVLFGFVPVRPTPYMMLIKWVNTAISTANETMTVIILNYAFDLSSPHLSINSSISCGVNVDIPSASQSATTALINLDIRLLE